MGWGDAPTRSLTLPAGAGPADARIVMGPDIPPALATFSPDFVFASAIVFWLNATDFYFEAVALWVPVGTNVVVKGTYQPGPGVVIYEMTRLVFNELAFGTTAYNAVVPTVVFRSTQVEIEPTSPFNIDGWSAPRGLRDRAALATATGPIGAETVVLTGAPIPWRAGRAYEVLHASFPSGSIANNAAFYAIRRTNIAGAVLWNAEYQMSPTVGASQYCASRTIIRNATGATIVENLVLTNTANRGGTVSEGFGPTVVRYLEIRDCGAATDYPDAIQI